MPEKAENDVNIGTTTDCLFIMIACILRYEGDKQELKNKYCNATYNTLELCQSLSSNVREPGLDFSIKDKLLELNKKSTFTGGGLIKIKTKKKKLFKKKKSRFRKKIARFIKALI